MSREVTITALLDADGSSEMDEHQPSEDPNPEPDHDEETAFSHYDQLLEQMLVLPKVQFLALLKKYRADLKVTYQQYVSIVSNYQNHLADIQEKKKYIKPVNVTATDVNTRQQNTIAGGEQKLQIKINEAQDQIIRGAAQRALTFFDRRNVDIKDVVKVLTNQLECQSVPYTITGLTPFTLLTNSFETEVRMRPTGRSILKSLVKDDTRYIDYPNKNKILIKPFKTIIGTLAFVRKDVPMAIGKSFVVTVRNSEIESFGDSYFLQSARSILEIVNTTEQTMSYSQLDRTMHKLAVMINPNFSDLVRVRNTKKRAIMQVRSVFSAKTGFKTKQRESYERIIEETFALYDGHKDALSIECVFEEISLMRDFLMETKSVIVADYNASLRQKFMPIKPTSCDCLNKAWLIYGSGPINSAMVVHILTIVKEGSIEFVDPAIDTDIIVKEKNRTIRFINATYETYDPQFDVYCCVISDIGTMEHSRNHFTNDYRYTNQYARLLYERWNTVACSMVLKVGFAYGLPRCSFTSVWHFKPHNPEFWFNIEKNQGSFDSDVINDLLIEKLHFNALRLKAWKRDELLIAKSAMFPIFDTWHFLTTELPFNIHSGKFTPYSNSIHTERTTPYRRPTLGFLQPEFNLIQKKVMNDLQKSDDIQSNLALLETAELTPFQKFSVVAFLLSKRVGVVGSRLKKSLGEVHGGIKDSALDATTLANVRYLTINDAMEEKKIVVKTLTPKMIDICVDYNRIIEIITTRPVFEGQTNTLL